MSYLFFNVCLLHGELQILDGSLEDVEVLLQGSYLRAHRTKINAKK
jgi:hypothetical protein